MAIYLYPKNNLTFKRVFSEHKHLCISLINSLLKFKGKIQVKEKLIDAIAQGELIGEARWINRLLSGIAECH